MINRTSKTQMIVIIQWSTIFRLLSDLGNLVGRVCLLDKVVLVNWRLRRSKDTRGSPMFYTSWTARSISCVFFFSSRRRHTRFDCDWSSDVCSSDLSMILRQLGRVLHVGHVERFNGAVQELRKIVERPVLVESRRLGPFVPRVQSEDRKSVV